jgi:ribosomal protein L21E
MQHQITQVTNYKHSFHTSGLVAILVNAVPKGANGASPSDYDGISVLVVGKGGYVYDVQIQVKKMNYVGGNVGHVYTLDLSKIMDGYKNVNNPKHERTNARTHERTRTHTQSLRNLNQRPNIS